MANLLVILFSPGNYTGVDPKHEFGNKKEEQQASRLAREPRTGDPGTGDPRTGDPPGGPIWL